MTDDRELKAKELNEEAIKMLKHKVKVLLAESGYTLEKLAKDLNDKYYTKESKANLSSKLARGSLRYIEMWRILDVLEYDLLIRPKYYVDSAGWTK